MENDNINHPKHYETDKVECIEAMEITQGRGAVMSFCLCNAFKYLWRHQRKNGVEDIKKARWYLDKYIEMAEKSKAEINEKFGYMGGGYCDKEECSGVKGLDSVDISAKQLMEEDFEDLFRDTGYEQGYHAKAEKAMETGAGGLRNGQKDA